MPAAKPKSSAGIIQAEVTGTRGPGHRIFGAMSLLTPIRQLTFAAFAFALTISAPCLAKRQVVLELYTSQGCSSCPPADALIERLSDRPDILGLSLPVTYWDMLGWKDTLASEANTRRQKAYAASMGRGGVYTPQIIVDGVTDVVGSREAQVEAAIGARRSDMREVPITLSVSPAAVHIGVGALPEKNTEDATVWLFHVLSHAVVRIGAGENKGHNLDYRNVVRDVRAVALWKGQPLTLDIPRGDQSVPGYDSVAVVVQENPYGRVIGARMISTSSIQQH
jgi:hypothetical protein